MPYSEIIEQKLHFLGFDNQATSSLKNIQTILEPSIDQVLDGFYEQLSHDPEIMALFPTDESMLTAKNFQKIHWIDILYSADSGKSLFENAQLFAKNQERKGLSLGVYLAGYSIMMNQFLNVISDHYGDDNIHMTQMIQALHKAIFLDIDTVVDSYLQEKDNATKKVLMHVEQFTTSIKQINRGLAKQASNHQANLSALLSDAESLDQQMLQLDQKITQIKQLDYTEKSNRELMALLQESAVLLKENHAIHGGIAFVEKQGVQFAEQMNGLNFRYDQLQNENKCHFIRLCHR